MAYVVYCLTAPSGRRYVGYTSRSPSARWEQHVRDAHNGSAAPLHRAIRKHGAAAFAHIVLARPAALSAAKALEIQWISWLNTASAAGYNATTGGDGAPGVVKSAATRAKISAAQTGRVKTAEHRQRIAASLRGRKLSPEHAAKLLHAARNQSSATRAKIAAASKERVRTEAELARMRQWGESWRGRKRGPMSEAAKVAKRALAASRTPEEREATSAKLRAAHASRPRKRVQTVETRAKISASLRARHASAAVVQDVVPEKETDL